MKKVLTLWMSLFILSISLSAQTQTLVNRDWVTTGGSPNAIFDFQAARPVPGGIVTVGNTYQAGQQSFLIEKQTADGNQVYKKEYNGTGSSTCFATDVCSIPGSNYTYVTGVEGDTSSRTASITTMRIDSNGVITWVSKYTNSYRGYNLGFRIIPDPAGSYVYVCGTSQTNVADFALTVIKYAVSTGTQQWVATYDSVGLYDAGVDMRVVGSALIVYGISGTSTTSGDFITRSYSTSTGALTSQSRINNPSAYVSKPVAIGKDANDNIYLTGIVKNTSEDIILIKLDTALNLKWSKTIDGGFGKNDEVAAIKVDSRNNIILTGFAGNADTSKSIWTLKLRDSVIVWGTKRYCTIAGKDAKGADVDLDANNNIYVTGKVWNGTANSNITIAYDTNGVTRWEKLYNYSSASDDQGRNIKVDSGGYIYVYGKSTISGSSAYTTMKFEQTSLPTALAYDTPAASQFINNEIMVRFNPSILSQRFINNLDLLYTKIDSLIPDSVIVKLSTKCGVNLHGSTLSRIVTGMAIKDSISISRGGDTVAIPKFWASMLLSNIPGGKSLQSIRDSLNLSQPYIYYTAYNHVGVFDACDASDPSFSAMTALYDPAHADDINWCPSYTNGDVGSSNIKIGIYDGGVNSLHEDLQYNGATKIAGGNDYTGSTPIPILSNPNSDTYGHGTAMTGIIGAQTANGKGVAGVAGGNATNSGCALYCDRIGAGSSPSITTATLYNALISDVSSSGFALNVINHSYHYVIGDNFMHDAFRFAARNGVVNVASTGDDGQDGNYYPSGFTNLAFTIRVGASDSTGDWAGSFTNGGGSTWGYGVDLIAPGLNYQYKILSYTSNTGYTNSIDNGTLLADGTSISAAFVSGASGLLLSKGKALSMPSGNIVSMAPEDVKNVLKYKATIPTDPYYDPTYAGSGRLNIGHALDSIAYPKYKFRHYSGIPPFDAGFTITTNQMINLTWDYETNPADTLTRIVKGGVYTADIYKFEADVPYALGSTESIISGWTLPNQSDFWGPKHSSLLTGYDVDPDPLPSYNLNFSTHQIQLFGYVYHIRKDHAGDSLDIWVPFRADSGLINNSHKMSFSMWTIDTSRTLALDEVKSNVLLAKIYPSPTSSSLSIDYYLSEPSDIQVRILDINSRVVQEVNSTESEGTHSLSINIGGLASSMYLCEIRGKDGRFIEKFIKE